MFDIYFLLTNYTYFPLKPLTECLTEEEEIEVSEYNSRTIML